MNLMHRCPACGSARIYPSRMRSIVERIRRIFSENQVYRCHACNHRDWYPIIVPTTEGPDAAPDDLRTGISAQAISADEIDRLDTR